MVLTNGRIRDFLRKHVGEESLKYFEDICFNVDLIRDELVSETDVEAAFELSVEWTDEIILLANTEISLLEALLVKFGIDEAPIRERIAALQQEKDRSWQTMQRGGGWQQLPFEDQEPRRKQMRKDRVLAKEQNQAYADRIRKESAKLKASINLGGIRRDIRSLQQFVRTRTPKPSEPRRLDWDSVKAHHVEMIRASV